jgi:hypothetical protein
MEESKKQKNEQPWTLTYTLVLQTMSYPLSSFFFCLDQLVPSKMMPCKLNHNLICLNLVSLSKGLGTNLKFLTNRNAQFHWTLFLGPLSKVGLSLVCEKWHTNTTLVDTLHWLHKNLIFKIVCHYFLPWLYPFLKVY